MTPEEKGACDALRLIMPELEKRSLRWVIAGGFACYVYGVPRKLTDIDIDIDTSKDTAAFKGLLAAVSPYITQPLIHFVDQKCTSGSATATLPTSRDCARCWRATMAAISDGHGAELRGADAGIERAMPTGCCIWPFKPGFINRNREPVSVLPSGRRIASAA